MSLKYEKMAVSKPGTVCIRAAGSSRISSTVDAAGEHLVQRLAHRRVIADRPEEHFRFRMR